MSTNLTVARPTRSFTDGHWYDRQGNPCHFTEKKDGTGLRPTTVADARKHGYLPSVTSILKCLDKPALTNWLIEQAVLTVLTAPRLNSEPLDAFINRILHVEKQQDQESQAARDLGTNIHDAIEQALKGNPYDGIYDDYVAPVVEALQPLGRVVATEKVLVGDGYAGKTDCLCESDHAFSLVDFKTTKKIPKDAYPEHRMQLAAYAAALGNTGDKPIRTINIYISTLERGAIGVCAHQDWTDTYRKGFRPILEYWQWANRYNPGEELRAAA